MIQARNIDTSSIYEIVGTTTGDFNYAIKYADGRLTCYQRYTVSNKVTNTWGQIFSADAVMTPKNYAVPFISAPATIATPSALGNNGMNFWITTDGGPSSTTKPMRFQLSRGTSGSIGGSKIDIIAEGFWKKIDG